MVERPIPNPAPISALAPGLKHKGKLLIVAAPHDNVQVSPLRLGPVQRLREGLGGHAGLRRAHRHASAQVNEACERRLSHKARFRVVLKMP